MRRVWGNLAELKFEEVPVRVGDPILSVGLLPEAAGYKSYYMESFVSTTLRGEMPRLFDDAGYFERDAQNRVIAGKAAIGAVVDAFVREVQRREEADGTCRSPARRW